MDGYGVIFFSKSYLTYFVISRKKYGLVIISRYHGGTVKSLLNRVERLNIQTFKRGSIICHGMPEIL
eukprot:snap_masked-scaffold_9-processed-gene-6.22-mRNA-1 protein AED:1.00 eAED:1.00 QI:0/0/0/0/1/1/3/0/66